MFRKNSLLWPRAAACTAVLATLFVTCSAVQGAITPPKLNSISPASAVAKGPGFTMTVSGSNFESGAVVQWNGATLPTTQLSSTSESAAVDASYTGSSGVAQVRIKNPDGGLSGPLTFTIQKAPVLMTLSPSGCVAGSKAFSLSVSGSNLTPDLSLTWNGSALATTYVSASQLTASISAAMVSSAGTVTVGATNGMGITANTLPFTVNPAPSITSISPNGAVAGQTGFTMTVYGAAFAGSDSLDWNGSPIAMTYVSPTQLSAYVSAPLLANPGTATVVVVNPTGIVSNSATFTISSGMSATAISPSSCLAASAGFTLTVSGTGFPSNAVINWAGSPVQTTYVNSTTLTAQIAAPLVCSVGTANVIVSSASAPSTAAIQFKINPHQGLSGIVPSGMMAGSPGFTLSVSGGNFAADNKVMWNGSALPTTYSSSTQLTAQVDASLIKAQGTAQVTVVSSTGVACSPTAFSINPAPSITSVGPTNIAAGLPGFTMTVTGANFTGSCVVRLAGNKLVTTYVSPTLLRPYIPASLIATAGNRPVTVVLNGIISRPATLTVNAEPQMGALVPAQVTVGSPDMTLTVNGSNFLNGSTVSWNGAALPTTFVSSTQITAVVPAANLATPCTSQVSFSNPDGGSSAAMPFRVVVGPNTTSLWAQKLVWFHYMEHFPLSISNVASQGIYGSLFPLDISNIPTSQWQSTDVGLIKSSGADGMVVDIFTQDDVIDSILTSADQQGILVSPMIDLTAMVQSGGTYQQMDDAVVAAVQQYCYIAQTHSSAAREGNNYLIWNFGTYLPLQGAGPSWPDALSRISASGCNTMFVGDISGAFCGVNFPQSQIAQYQAVFPAGFIWAGGHAGFMSQTLQQFQLAGQPFANGAFSGSCRPGGNYNDDQCTAFYRNSWNIDLTNPIQWIHTATWNDYIEQSNVSPSSDWNMTRNELTQWYAAQFRGGPAPFNDARLYVTAPQSINMNQASTAEALIINPTNSALTATVQLYDGAGNAIGSPVQTTVGGNSVGAATVPVNLAAMPAGGYIYAAGTMSSDTATMATANSAPTIVYPAGAMPNLNVVYYSIPALEALQGQVGLTLTPTGTTGQATATITLPSSVTADGGPKFVELLYNNQEVQNFYSTGPFTATVSTAGAGYYVARVTDAAKRVGYSVPVYVGP